MEIWRDFNLEQKKRDKRQTPKHTWIFYLIFYCEIDIKGCDEKNI